MNKVSSKKTKPESIQVNLGSEIGQYVDIILKESDRGAVILCGTIIEEFVQEKFLPPKPRFNFDQKIAILKNFFVPTGLSDVLSNIRDIRNTAAHSKDAFSFSNLGQQFSNNLVNQTSKMGVYKQVENFKLSDRSNLKKTQEITFRELINKLPKGQGSERLEFLLVIIAVITYLSALSDSGIMQLKKFIPDLK